MSFKKVISLKTTQSNEVINPISQQIIGSTYHTVKTQYRILSKNDFGIIKDRINIGLFNKKTDFRISEKESIMVLNKKTMLLENPDVLEIQKNNKNYFLLYRYSFDERNNMFLELHDKNTNTKHDVELSYEFGKRIALSQTEEIKFSEIELLFIKSFLSTKYGKVSFNKYILVNSNYKFLIGLLHILNDNVIPSNLNIYSISLVLNLLECGYSIRKTDGKFIVRYLNNQYLYSLLFNSGDFKIINFLEDSFRKLKYFIKDNKIVKNYSKINEDISIEHNSNLVNTGKIELIPCNDIIFEKIENCEDDKMIDLVMEHDEAHNFFLNGTPSLKNSDGDIMAAIAIFSKEAAKEAEENFSTVNKTKFINSASLAVQNFGVKTDSLLGLYNCTK